MYNMKKTTPFEEREPSEDEYNGNFRSSTERQKIMLSKRRQRLSSLPTKLAQTDEELQNECLKNMLPTSKSMHDRNNYLGKSCPDTGQNYRLVGKLAASETIEYKTTDIKNTSRHENIYKGLVNNLLHPLGATDCTIGLRPGDLLDHIREVVLGHKMVFQVEQEDHEMYILEEMPNAPRNIQVNVTVLEANGLKGPDFTEDNCNSYCLVSLHHPATRRSSSLKGSPKLAMKTSPKTSPRASPIASPMVGRQEPESLESEINRTSTVKHSSHPIWNEEFSLDIKDFLTDEVHVLVCDKDVPQDGKEKQHTSKSFLSVLRHGDHENSEGIGHYRKIVLPVRNISVLGTDEWYDIVSLGTSKGKQKSVGKCHLRLGISYKQDFEDNYMFSNEDYYQAYRQFHKYTYQNSRANPYRHVDDHYGSLSLKDHRILKMFAEAHGISKLTQAIVDVICMMEVQCEENATDAREVNLNQALTDLRMTWATMQIGQKTLLDKMPLTDTEISNYRKVASQYIQKSSKKIQDFPDLFPPTVKNLKVLKSKLGVIIQLLSLDLWEPNCATQKEISRKMQGKLNDDVARWIDEGIARIAETNTEIRDTAIPEIERMIDLVNATCSHCSILPVVKQFYTSLGINYYRIVSFIVEKKISSTCELVTKAINNYKKRYNNFSVNIMIASKLSLRLYFSLRKFYSCIRDNVSRRDIFRLSLYHYQEWFEEAMVYWLQTFRTECIQRMEKALEIDKDVVVVTSLVKYSHSSVDVLSCFAQVIGEWRNIDFRDPDCALMGVTNVSDIICDGARLYADKIYSILERNCYYEDNLNAEFDVNDRLCITLNNIEHVRLYLEELPQLLAWDTIIMMISTRYENDDVGKQSAATLQRLIDTSNEEILMKCSKLLKQIVDKMRVDIERYVEIFTKKEPQKPSSFDLFLGYLATNLKTLNEQLMPAIYPYIIEQLWNVILLVFDSQVLIGEDPEYHSNMKQHLRAMCSFFLQNGLEKGKLCSDHYYDFKDRLDLMSKKSEDLMLMYYHKLTQDNVTPTECYGYLAFKVAYMEETRGNVTIFVAVLRGSDLPGLDSSGYSDPYVEVSLQPKVMFGFSQPQKTHIVKQTLNPVFNVTFQFPNVSGEFLKKDGACLLMTVYDHDRIGQDDFAGEVIVSIPSILKIGLDRSFDKLPAIIMPLKRPSKPLDGPFTVLSQREWDKVGKRFITDRLRFIDHQPERTDKQKSETGSKGFFSSILSSVMSLSD